jgi:hypothetical protein
MLNANVGRYEYWHTVSNTACSVTQHFSLVALFIVVWRVLMAMEKEGAAQTGGLGYGKKKWRKEGV